MDRLPVWVLSLGCPKNRVDTEHFLGSLGIELETVEDIAESKLVFINTCGFIESAVRESVRAILDVVEDLKDLPNKPKVVVAGCMVGRYGAKELALEIPEVDLFLATADLKLWPDAVRRLLGYAVEPKLGRLLSTPTSYAWLKIAEGCRHQCAFCTIPMIRGTLKSVSEEQILSEAKTLLDQGVRELVCVAQDVAAWGQDSGQSLISLLEKLVALPKLLWLRLLYLYPAGLTPDLLQFMAEAKFPLLPYFDIPIQHSHPQILERMGRPFARDPRHTLDLVRKYIPDAIFRTTLIVGFPGETEEHFQHLIDFVDEGHFLHLGVFSYEREEGTKAFDYPDQVSHEVAEARRSQLLEVQRAISSDLLEQYVGQRQDVLVDSVNPEWPGLFNGRVWFQAPEVDGQTYISGTGVEVGQVIKAEIVESNDYDLTALV